MTCRSVSAYPCAQSNCHWGPTAATTSTNSAALSKKLNGLRAAELEAPNERDDQGPTFMDLTARIREELEQHQTGETDPVINITITLGHGADWPDFFELFSVVPKIHFLIWKWNIINILLLYQRVPKKSCTTF